MPIVARTFFSTDMIVESAMPCLKHRVRQREVNYLAAELLLRCRSVVMIHDVVPIELVAWSECGMHF